MLKVEKRLRDQYVSNQARSIARLFALHGDCGALSIGYSDIAEEIDLTVPTVIKYIRELTSKEVVHVYRHPPFENVYELNV